jgi:putative (di)nucleoside polyphosphate hydrolase
VSKSAQEYRSGVGILLLNGNNRAFVGQRIDNNSDAWQMPQGGIDPGETPHHAALRELKEEIGSNHAEILAESERWFEYDLPAELRGRVWRGRYRGQRQKWFAMRFLGEDREIDIATEHAEFSAWKWVLPADLPRLIVPFKRQLYREVLAEFGAIIGS